VEVGERLLQRHRRHLAQPRPLRSALRHGEPTGQFAVREVRATGLVGVFPRPQPVVEHDTLVEFNGETEHVHLLVDFPPTVALSRLVNSLKGVSSRRLRQEFPDLARHYWRARRLWSGSYFAGSVGGAPLNVLRAYIEQQRRPHDAIHFRPEGRNPLAKAR
jgi:putative transposase